MELAMVITCMCVIAFIFGTFVGEETGKKQERKRIAYSLDSLTITLTLSDYHKLQRWMKNMGLTKYPRNSRTE